MFCVFCHFTSDDSVQAFTVMNGHAVCIDHAENGTVQSGGTFSEVLMHLRRNEPRKVPA